MGLSASKKGYLNDGARVIHGHAYAVPRHIHDDAVTGNVEKKDS